MSIRPATHAGTWYSNSPTKLRHQLDTFFDKAKSLGGEHSTANGIPGARILIGPHAGYAYSGERLAETFNVWDTSKVKRVFLLGPSHHVYFKNYALVSPYQYYETPFGNIPVDTSTIKELISKKSTRGTIFKFMSEEIDEDEHSFEMHAPYIYYKGEHAPHGVPKIIPILISGMDEGLQTDIVQTLLPYMDDEENHFIISSDFCHWGSRFGYTNYVTTSDISLDNLQKNITSLGMFQRNEPLPIFKSIELLDKLALDIASSGSSADWKKYINISGNTICGQKPISVVLKLLEHYENYSPGESKVFNWIGYSQSNPVRKSSESSVSYASGYVKL
ncbi:hypothetical protein G210_5044 [Candida maltosa Xu316]|uniref:MEMO1 family protein n=1 Tax=Candida maltosa (strain Xu316) TaxID=1245528 RepID=M3K5A7_CANMX|nr:hypothetical protein G210_5044 [Candida maltosa Xu316]